MEKDKINLGQSQNPVSLESVFWQWQSGPNPDPWAEKDPVKRSWQDYSDDDCRIIEEAFLLNKDLADLNGYEIDFKRMVQVNKKIRSRMRRVRRQDRSRFMMDICEPNMVVWGKKTANQTLGTIQNFLEGIMKKAPEAYGLYQGLKSLSMDSKYSEFEDVVKQVVLSIEKGAEIREKTTEAKKIISRIGDNSATLGDFLRTILKIYTMENFLCYWLNKLIIKEDWEGINVIIPFLVCLAYTFKRSEYIIKCQEPQGLMNSLRVIVGKQRLLFYKGAALSKEQLELYDPKKRRHFSWDGIVSVSRDENVAMHFMRSALKKAHKMKEQKVGVFFRIEANFASPEDYEGIIDLFQNSLGLFPDEQEVILGFGTVFKLRKTREIEKDIYEVSLKVKKRWFEEAKENSAMIGNLQQEKVVIEGLPSQPILRQLEYLKGSKIVRRLEIVNSGIEENVMEEIERVRVTTTNLKKEDIKLKDNVIVVKSLSLLVHHFSAESLNEIFMLNKILFKDLKGGVNKNKELELKALTLSEEALNKFKQNKQLKELGEKIKDEGQLESLDLSIPNILNSHDELLEFLQCIKEIKTLLSLNLKFHQKQTLSKEILGLFCETIGSSSELKNLSLELISSDEGLGILGKSLVSMKSLEQLCLNFSGSNEVSDEGLDRLKNGLVELTSLRHLSLSFASCRKVADQGICHMKDVLSSLPALQQLSLDFNECSKISNEGLNHLKTGFTKLAYLQTLSLSFEKCVKISDEGLNHLAGCLESLTSLQHLALNFNGCNQILDEGLGHIKKALVLLNSLQSLSLNFTGCTDLSDEGLNHLKNSLITFTSLKNLSLLFSECNDISDKGINFLKDGLTLLKDLQHLSLHFHLCRMITNDGLNSVKESLILLTSLQHLSLEFSGRNSISDEGLNHLKTALVTLKSLQHLSLDFSWCNKISYEGLQHLKEGLLSLTSLQYLSLNFKKSDKLIDEGLNHLMSGLLLLKSLQHLSMDFSWCTRISDEGLYLLKSVLGSLVSLQYLSLDFSGCNKISDDGLNHLKSGLVSGLSVRYLSFDFSWCHYISDEGLKSLKDGLKSLTSLQHLELDFNDCNRISDEGLGHLKSALKLLRSLQHLYLYFSGCPKITGEGLDQVYEELKFVSELVCNK